MGLLSSLFGKNGTVAQERRFQAALQRSQQRPLDSDCCRLIIVSPVRVFSFDVPLVVVEEALKNARAEGVDVARARAAQVMGPACSGRNDSRPDLLRLAALAYFDAPFLNGRAPWNTLTLNVIVDGTAVNVACNTSLLSYASR